MKQPETTLRAHQIIDGLQGKEDLVIAMRGLNSERVKPIAQQFSTMLNNAQKFLLTEDIPFPEANSKLDLIPEAANLPADICYFERTQPQAGTWGALCFDISEAVTTYLPTGDLSPKWACVLFIKSLGAKVWAMSPVVTTVYLNTENKIKLSTVEMFPPTGEKRNADDLEAEKSMSGLTRAAASEIMFFLQMLSCSNVTMTKIEKPHALNKKRLAKKLAPVDAYHILHLPQHVTPQYDTYPWSEDGKRTSPRLHFRRGHVRRVFRNGVPEHLTWVSHCMVGDSALGEVMKHYTASKEK